MRTRILDAVRITLDIDDALLRRAKELAARRGLTLTALIERALRDELREGGGARKPAPDYRMPTFGDADAQVHHEPEELTRVLMEDDATELRRGAKR